MRRDGSRSEIFGRRGEARVFDVEGFCAENFADAGEAAEVVGVVD